MLVYRYSVCRAGLLGLWLLFGSSFVSHLLWADTEDSQKPVNASKKDRLVAEHQDSSDADTGGLGVAAGPTGKRYLTYHGKPLLAFGQGDEMRLFSGAADVRRWAAWQKQYGMNLLRAYPTSVPIEVYGTDGLHPFHKTAGGWDVDQWNEAYFEHFSEAARVLEEHGIVLHLQLWQIVFFKGGSARWEANYINPKNNVNEWTRVFQRGHDYIDAPQGSRAREHQRQWVWRILDAVKDRNNVWIDCINELGNEMGKLPWAVEVVGWIREWELNSGKKLLVGVDSEHHYKPEVFGPVAEHFDLIILNELRSPEHARQAIEAFSMPAVTVRSSDARNQPDDYVFTTHDRSGPEHQTRYRTLCYRSLFAGVQSIGAYWKMEVSESDYKDMEHWPIYSRNLRAFWDRINQFWPNLHPTDSIIKGSTVTPKAYALANDQLVMLYLECGPKVWNQSYEESILQASIPFQPSRFESFDPSSSGTSSSGTSVSDPSKLFRPLTASQQEGHWELSLPAFQDDLVILVWRD